MDACYDSYVLRECGELHANVMKGLDERGLLVIGEGGGLAVDGLLLQALVEPLARFAEVVAGDICEVDSVLDTFF